MLSIGAILGLAGIAAGSSLASNIGSAVSNYYATKDANETNLKIARETNAFNSAEAEKQRSWEEYMSNTAITRRMADLKAAGVNPLMALGSEASTPSGASASGVSARVSPGTATAEVLGAVGDAISSMANTALKVSIMKDMLGYKATKRVFSSLGRYVD